MVPPWLFVCEEIQMLQLLINARSIQFIQLSAPRNLKNLRLFYDECSVEFIIDIVVCGDGFALGEIQKLLMQWLDRWTKGWLFVF
jgi:hypothetical protein